MCLVVSWCASELGCDSANGLQDLLPDTLKADLNRGDTGLMRSGLVLHAAGDSQRQERAIRETPADGAVGTAPRRPPECGRRALVDFRPIRQNLGMNPDSHEEFPVTLDDATKAKLDEAIASTGLTAGDVLRLAIETGLHVMESARRN